MLFFRNQSRVFLAVVALTGFAGWEFSTFAQDDVGAGKFVPKVQEPKGDEYLQKGLSRRAGSSNEFDDNVPAEDAAESLQKLATLDDVRAMPTRESYNSNDLASGGAGMAGNPGRSGGAGAGAGGSGGGMSAGGGEMGMGSASPPDARQIAMIKINELRGKLTSPDEDRAEVEKQLRSALSEYFIADLQHRVKELDAVKARVQEMEARLQKRLDLKQEAVDLQLKRMQHEADGLEFVVPNDPGGSGAFGGGMGGGISGGAGGDFGSDARYPGSSGHPGRDDPFDRGGPGTAPTRAKGK